MFGEYSEMVSLSELLSGNHHSLFWQGGYEARRKSVVWHRLAQQPARSICRRNFFQIRSGEGVGVSRAKDAIDMALNNAVLGKVQLEQATALLVSISGASDLTLQEVIPRIPYAVSTLISACLRLIWL